MRHALQVSPAATIFIYGGHINSAAVLKLITHHSSPITFSIKKAKSAYCEFRFSFLNLK